MATKITPPFVWIATHFRWLPLAGLLVIATFLRLYHLPSLPPGLYSGEAQIGLQAAQLAEHGVWPRLSVDNQYAPLWIWLQALPVRLLGHTVLALRLWPALLGVLAVYLTWLWARRWFSPRVGWLAGFFVAVTPWSITLSRNAETTALIPVLVVATLWTATRAYEQDRWPRWLAAAAVLALDLLAGPLGWLLGAATLMLAGIRLVQLHQLGRFSRPRLVALGTIMVGVILAGWLVASSSTAARQLPAATGLSLQPATLIQAVGATLLMFNVHGDENFRHNLNGQPLLNVFVGLMFIAGLLVAISRLQRRAYRVILTAFSILLLPAALSLQGAPNAAHAAAVIPLVAALAAIGVSYMLELWYATFPINSAARATGQAMIIVLLLLSLFQGYTQYFRAWAASSQTFTAYNEGAVAAAQIARQAPAASSQRFVVASADEQPVVAYLAPDAHRYQLIQSSQVAGLPIGPGARQFIVTLAARDETAKNLTLKFPGGRLQPHLSRLSNNELYYTYEIAP